MPIDKRITDFDELVAVADDDFVEVVDVSDTTGNAAGTSYKAQKKNVVYMLGHVLRHSAPGVSDTEALQAAVDAIPAGGTVFAIARTYMIDSDGVNGGIRITKPLRWIAEKGAIFQAITGSADRSTILHISNTSDVEIAGGTYIGDRATNPNTAEWGHGINFEDVSDVHVHDLEIKDCKGDGLYLGSTDGLDDDFLVERVVIQNTRRWGITYLAGARATFRDCTIKNQNSTLGFGGAMDFEDQIFHGKFADITIDNCKYINNEQNGAITIQSGTADGRITNFKILNSLFDSNNGAINLKGYLVDDVKIVNNTIKGGTSAADVILRGALLAGSIISDVKFDKNTLTYGAGVGVQLGGDADETMEKMIFSKNTFNGYVTSEPMGASLGTIRKIKAVDNTFAGCRSWSWGTAAEDCAFFHNTYDAPATVTPAAICTGVRTKFDDNTVISAGENDGLQVLTAINATVSNNTISGYTRFGLYMLTDSVLCKVSDNMVGSPVGASNHYHAPSPAGAGSQFKNNINFDVGTGTAYNIVAAHVSDGNV